MGRGNLIKKRKQKLLDKAERKAQAQENYRKLQAAGFEGYRPVFTPRAAYDVAIYPYDEASMVRGAPFSYKMCYLGGPLHKQPIMDRGRPILIKRRAAFNNDHHDGNLWDEELTQVETTKTGGTLAVQEIPMGRYDEPPRQNPDVRFDKGLVQRALERRQEEHLDAAINEPVVLAEPPSGERHADLIMHTLHRSQGKTELLVLKSREEQALEDATVEFRDVEK